MFFVCIAFAELPELCYYICRSFLEAQRMLVKLWSTLVLLLVFLTATPNLMFDLRVGSSRGLEEGGTAEDLGCDVIAVFNSTLVLLPLGCKFFLYFRLLRQFSCYLYSDNDLSTKFSFLAPLFSDYVFCESFNSVLMSYIG